MADGGDDRSAVTGTLATEALKEAGQHLLGLLVHRAAEAASQRVAGLTDRLSDVTESWWRPSVRARWRAVAGRRSRRAGPATGEAG